MGRTWTRRIGLLALGLTAAACVDARSRPPTSLDDVPDPFDGPLAVITHPVEGQRFLEQTWITGQGVQVTYAGTFRDGDELRVLAYLDYPDHSETQPFHVTRFTIDGEPDKATFVRGSPDRFRDASGVTIFLEIHDPRGFLVSTDSVHTQIQ